MATPRSTFISASILPDRRPCDRSERELEVGDFSSSVFLDEGGHALDFETAIIGVYEFKTTLVDGLG